MTATITRSTGIKLGPGMPWGGTPPGGGYDGKTKRLDRAVARFAKWLSERIGGPVQIRFNSHRLSGGAYLSPGRDADAPFDINAPEIGVGARLVIPADVKRRRDRAWAKGQWRSLPALEHEDCWNEKTPLTYNILIHPQYLRNPDDLGEHEPGASFGYWTVNTPQEAYRLLKRLLK